MKQQNKSIIIALIALAAIIAGALGYNRYASATRVALISFPPYMTASIQLSNVDKHVKYTHVAPEEYDKLSGYDCILGFGMGLKFNEEESRLLQRAIDKGVAVNIYAATQPETKISTLDSVRLAAVNGYLGHGNKKNYRNLAHYIRAEIDGKKLFVTQPEPVAESVADVIYHLDEERTFATVAEYEKYLQDKKQFNPAAPKVAMVGGFNDPFSGNRDNIDSIITSFERAGMTIYPISAGRKRLQFLEEVNPQAVIYFPHGRIAMGQADVAVDWLKERNIPLFSPLTILTSQQKWEEDKMGMFGGFLSQSVVMPELDGAIYPYVLNVQEIDKEGFYRFKASPERLARFTQIVSNFVALKKKANAEKKLAIFYFKGPGQSSLVAQGLETTPSLYNLLKRLRTEGYKVDNLPADAKAFERMLMQRGSVLSVYAKGAFDDYLEKGDPLLIEKSEYEAWAKQSMPAESYSNVTALYGEAPGEYMSVTRDGKQYVAVAALQFGNVAVLPQPMAGYGSDEFAIVHGAKTAPPHTYIAPYLWAQHGFSADAMMHFGTHGSLEFTPQKQVALSRFDWGDILVGTVPHFYYYTIGNIGESIIAKRRSYASLISYITPAFSETKTRAQYRRFTDAVNAYYKAAEADKDRSSLLVKKVALEMGLHRDLRLDSVASNPYSEEDIERLENFAEEIANEKMSATYYITGIPYPSDKTLSSVMAMSADPIAYSVAALDRMSGKVSEKQLKNNVFFTKNYLEPAKNVVKKVLGGTKPDSLFIAGVIGVSPADIAQAKQITTPPPSGMAAMMAAMAAAGTNMPSTMGGGKDKPAAGGHPGNGEKHSEAAEKHSGESHDSKACPDCRKAQRHKKKAEAAQKSGGKPAGMSAAGHPGMSGEKKSYSAGEKARARAIVEAEQTISNILRYKKALEESPEMELQAVINSLAGGYLAPSSGGDPVANPTAVPTGRNLYSINAENTPSEVAWDKGVALAEATIEQYRKLHNGEYPRKVSYTFWSSEFIETQGATIAQALYMLGVEPVRNTFGRVADLRLIPAETLGRPRIDVVVQTSGQFRDLAASRLALITRAVEMAAKADDGKTDNFVTESTLEVERQLVEQGVTPKAARELSTRRVFGGINGMYGTGIQEMITASDKWENEKEIAEVYLNNMGATYADDKTWGDFNKGLLRAALHNTDAIVHPRQSNMWGALSLDHVYEFMGGMNLTIRNVTGKDPDAFFADYRNRNNVRVQDLKEAIGVEARSTILNPEFVKELVAGGASGAGRIEEVATNTFGWNVAKPDVIDNELWNEMYEIYVKDKFNLGTQAFFERENPAALQEITAVMMETARKGMWKATEAQLKELARVHTQMVTKFGAKGSGFSGGNKKLQDFIAQKADSEAAKNYTQQIRKSEQSNSAEAAKDGKVLKKEELSQNQDSEKNLINGIWIAGFVLIGFVVLLWRIKKRRKS